MDLLAALETIRNASDATLHSHAAQTILTIRTISQRLQSLDPGFHATPLDPGSVQSPPHSPQSSETTTSKEQAGGSGPKSPQPLQAAWSSDYHAFSGERPGVPSSPHSPQLFQAIERTALRDDVVLSSLQIPRAPSLEVALTVPTAQSTPDGEYSGSARPESSRTPPDHVSQLLKGVKKSAGLIWKVSRESPSALLSRKRSSDEDPRLDHIRCIEGDRSLGNKEKLLRVLALRSIALEFTKKEQDNGVSPTRRNALYEQTLLPVVPDSSRANVFNFGKKDFLSKSIAAGLKYMVFEEVIATHCHNLPSICAAISAIVALQIDQFRRLRYDEMHCFAQRLISDDECIELSNQKMHLLDLVRSLSPWFNQVQNDYNLIFQSPVSGMESSRQKLPRNDLDSAPDAINNCPISIPQDIPSNGADTQSPEFAQRFYEQILNQPIDVSGIMDDIANRSCFDFEHIALDNATSSPETA